METHKIISASEARDMAMAWHRADRMDSAFWELVGACETNIKHNAEHGRIFCTMTIDHYEYVQLYHKLKQYLETHGYHVEDMGGYSFEISWEYS